jgi:hypothetical protein
MHLPLCAPVYACVAAALCVRAFAGGGGEGDRARPSGVLGVEELLDHIKDGRVEYLQQVYGDDVTVLLEKLTGVVNDEPGIVAHAKGIARGHTLRLVVRMALEVGQHAVRTQPATLVHTTLRPTYMHTDGQTDRQTEDSHKQTCMQRRLCRLTHTHTRTHARSLAHA